MAAMKACGYLTVAILALLGGCAGTGGVPATWHGRTEAELVGRWGAPAARYDQAGGGHYLIYRAKQPELTYHSGGSPSSLLVWRCVTSFRTDANGIIVSSDQEGSFGGCRRLVGQDLAAP